MVSWSVCLFLCLQPRDFPIPYFLHVSSNSIGIWNLIQVVLQKMRHIFNCIWAEIGYSSIHFVHLKTIWETKSCSFDIFDFIQTRRMVSRKLFFSFKSSSGNLYRKTGPLLNLQNGPPNLHYRNLFYLFIRYPKSFRL